MENWDDGIYYPESSDDDYFAAPESKVARHQRVERVAAAEEKAAAAEERAAAAEAKVRALEEELARLRRSLGGS